MGFWDALTGRARRQQARGPRLAVPGAERGDHAADRARAAADRHRLGLLPRRRAARRSGRLQADVVELLDADAEAPDVDVDHRLVRLHLADGDRRPRRRGRRSAPTSTPSTPRWRTQGFGSGLLCSLVPFVDGGGHRVGLVYLYKQGTFYPFAPRGPAAARQPAGDPGARRARRRAADREGPAAAGSRCGRLRGCDRPQDRIARAGDRGVRRPRSPPRARARGAGGAGRAKFTGVPMATINLITAAQQYQVATYGFDGRGLRPRGLDVPLRDRGRRADPAPRRQPGRAVPRQPVHDRRDRRRAVLRLVPARRRPTGVMSARCASSTTRCTRSTPRPSRRWRRWPRGWSTSSSSSCTSAAAGRPANERLGGVRRPGQPRPQEPALGRSGCRSSWRREEVGTDGAATSPGCSTVPSAGRTG